ncbi:MAG: hypothetical protein ACQCN4_10000 [Candidatus Bathyarchaeia archaeon]
MGSLDFGGVDGRCLPDLWGRTGCHILHQPAGRCLCLLDRSLNVTTAHAGDTIQVESRVNWHGHIAPEFKRQVIITDTYPTGNFELVSGNNTLQYSGYGGSESVHYALRVTNSTQGQIELPTPKLYLDNSEILLKGTNPTLEVKQAEEP